MSIYLYFSICLIIFVVGTCEINRNHQPVSSQKYIRNPDSGHKKSSTKVPNGKRSGHIKEIRDRRRLEFESSPYVAPMLNMDCGDMTGYPCQLYMQQYLNTYVYVNRSYNKIILPVANDADKPLPIEVVVTFDDLVNVDIVSGTMSVSIFIDYFWPDAFFSWNSSLTDNDDFIVVPNDMLWIPDIILYNAIGGFHSQIDEAAVFLDNTGLAWWSGRGVVTFSCNFDVRDFPFDSQKCSAEFSSWIYSLNNINITHAGVDVLDSFTNLAWEVETVSGHRDIRLLWGGAYSYSFAVFDVSIKRYSNHYWTSAIFPAIVITSIVLSGLWLTDFGPRISLSVTGLLTIIAIQWSIASQLPIAKSINWLSKFLLMCIFFIALVCVECYVSAVMAAKKHDSDLPMWVKYLIDLSLLHRRFRENHGDGEPTRDAHVEVELSELKKAMEDADVCNNDKVIESLSNPMNTPAQGVDTVPAMNSGSPTPTLHHKARVYTWKRGSRALDRLARVVIPGVFIAVVSIWLGEKMG